MWSGEHQWACSSRLSADVVRTASVGTVLRREGVWSFVISECSLEKVSGWVWRASVGVVWRASVGVVWRA